MTLPMMHTGGILSKRELGAEDGIRQSAPVCPSLVSPQGTIGMSRWTLRTTANSGAGVVLPVGCVHSEPLATVGPGVRTSRTSGLVTMCYVSSQARQI
jgi:hypothetical protein